jgi:glutamate-1-semialdehyde 2,1-aminomutase
MTYGVEPDIAVFGKALGNGYPIATVIGRKSVMNAAQSTFISSTMWTERIGFVTALATLKKMEDKKVPEFLVSYGKRIQEGWSRIAQKHDLKIRIDGIPPIPHISFETDEPLVVQTVYTQEMLSRGYLLGASLATSFAYSDDIIDHFIDDSDSVFGLIKEALESGNIKRYLKGDVAHAGFKRLT